MVEAMLMLNGFELSARVDESEAEVLAVAAGQRSREQFRGWVKANMVKLDTTAG